MEPTAPDWRAIGVAPSQTAGHPAAGRAVAALSTLHLAWLAGAFVVALVLGALVALAVMPTPGAVLVDTHDARPVAVADPATQAGAAVGALAPAVPAAQVTLVVDVEGAVARPGLVRVPKGARVADALELAGGFGPSVDLAAAAAALNLAQELTDGVKIVVPAIGEATLGGHAGSTTTGGQASAGLVDLNHATDAELDGLPGVGPATIAKIVAARSEAPFGSVDELRSRGIVGEATLGKLRDLVTVGR